MQKPHEHAVLFTGFTFHRYYSGSLWFYESPIQWHTYGLSHFIAVCFSDKYAALPVLPIFRGPRSRADFMETRLCFATPQKNCVHALSPTRRCPCPQSSAFDHRSTAVTGLGPFCKIQAKSEWLCNRVKGRNCAVCKLDHFLSHHKRSSHYALFF